MSTPDPRLSQLQRMIAAYRQSILTLDDAALSRLQTAYAPSRARLLRLIDALTGQLGTGGTLSTSEVMQLGRARELLRLIDEEVTTLANVAGQTIPQAQQIAVQQALERAHALTLAQAPDLASAARISAQWTALNQGAVTDLVGSLGDGSPLSSWIERVVPESVQTVRATLLDGVTRGINPNDLAAALAQATDLPLQRALTLSRTETLRAYRSASLQTYQANDDVLDGWTWSAAHDGRTCSACLAKSGQDFPLTVQFMPTHPRCRCSPLPKLKDDSLLPAIETGEEWFNRQPEKFRREAFPVGLRGDYDAGRVTLADMAHLRRDEVWGNSYQTATISQARANAKARLARGAEPKALPKPAKVAKKPTGFKTEAEARSYFESIGVDVGEMNGSKKTWQAVADVYGDETAAGFPVPPRLSITSKGGKTVAAYTTRIDFKTREILDDRIEVYARNRFWANPEKVSETLDGYLVVPNTRGVVTHEIGHWRHSQNITQDAYGYSFTNKATGEIFDGRFAYDSAERRAASRVSQYAATHRMEFVAEVYSGLRNGKVFDDEIIELYIRYGGPSA